MNDLRKKRELPKEDGWFQTYTGKFFFPLKPTIEMICIEDICHALSCIARFGGHAKFPYQVGLHSVHVSQMLEEHGPTVAMMGLLHDSGEAFIGDMVAPLKRQPEMKVFSEVENLNLAVIFQQFGLPPIEEYWHIIKKADLTALVTEADQLLLGGASWIEQIDAEKDPFWVIEEVPSLADRKKIFMDRYNELFRARMLSDEDRAIYRKHLKGKMNDRERFDYVLAKWDGLLERLGDE